MDEKPNIADLAPLKPYAVSIPTAQYLLGEKSVAALYNDGGRPEDDPLRVEFIKDGSKTLITLESIERRQRLLPIAKIKPPKPRAPRGLKGATRMGSVGSPAKTPRKSK